MPKGGKIFMPYQKSNQFMVASQRYYNTGCKRNHRDPNHCTDTCYTPEQSDPCQKPEDCCQPEEEYDVCPDRNTPQTIIDVLCSLINEQVEITVPFGVVTGTLLDVKRDYIIILENTGDQVLVPTENIESVSPMT